MGRIFYSTVQVQFDRRLVRILTTELGTVVIAMRPPAPDERGYEVGVDFTVRDAVKEMLTDWGPSDPGPGWLQEGQYPNPGKWGRYGIHESEETYPLTILAAFEAGHPALATVDTRPPEATPEVRDAHRDRQPIPVIGPVMIATSPPCAPKKKWRADFYGRAPIHATLTIEADNEADAQREAERIADSDPYSLVWEDVDREVIAADIDNVDVLPIVDSAHEKAKRRFATVEWADGRPIYRVNEEGEGDDCGRELATMDDDQDRVRRGERVVIEYFPSEEVATLIEVVPS